ncbi:chemotaxis response regulator protein-glutamate methylesterase [Candidatus Poribacteria bacterium]|nr:chemotaxis response regulator protein-glutamate methylesterase [Candidatus Poribacteria bacterium]
MRKIRVMVVDDSLFIRKVLSEIISSDDELEVVGTAMNGKIAIQNISQLKPDCITLDIEMPEMDGLATLKYIMKHIPIPIIMISSYTRKGAEETIEALNNGAADFIHKPNANTPEDLNVIAKELIQKIKMVVKIPIEKIVPLEIQEKEKISIPISISYGTSSKKIVAIGISTGGPNALRYLLSKISPELKTSILITQHMPAGFTEELAENLNRYSSLEVREAEDGEIISPGGIWIAPGGMHMQVKKNISNKYTLALDEISTPVSGHKPSVDVLFSSVAETYGKNSMAIIMTGMGRDGATGIGLIHKTGGLTIAQDEQSCVIYGMPRVAVEEGSIIKILPLSKIADEINIFGEM